MGGGGLLLLFNSTSVFRPRAVRVETRARVVRPDRCCHGVPLARACAIPSVKYHEVSSWGFLQDADRPRTLCSLALTAGTSLTCTPAFCEHVATIRITVMITCCRRVSLASYSQVEKWHVIVFFFVLLKKKKKKVFNIL